MRMLRSRPTSYRGEGSTARRSGFTLAEAAVTIAIVALTLSATMQALEVAKLKAAHTQNQKTAKELGLMTLGAIESGKWWDDIESGRTGSYADSDYPNFYWEVALGDETFLQVDEGSDDAQFDNWAHRRDEQLRREYDDRSENVNDEDEDEEATEPYEQVRIRITFPKLREYQNEVILERWMVWEQVYGEEEDEEGEGGGGDDGGGANGGGGTGDGGLGGGGNAGGGGLGGGR